MPSDQIQVPVRRIDDVNYARAIVGTVLGAIVGVITFGFLLRYGIYAMVMPGVLIGFGCGSCAGGRSISLGISTAIVALLVSLGLEWHFRPFIADNSLGYFLQHLTDLSAMTWITITIGTLAAFWFGRGR